MTYRTCRECGTVIPADTTAHRTPNHVGETSTALCPGCTVADDEAQEDPLSDDASVRFERAWARFCEMCFDTVAPEATYQAWFAHFLMEEFDVLQVVREVSFGARYLDEAARQEFPGSNLMVDVMVLRQPKVDLPHRAWLGPPVAPGVTSPRSGLERARSEGPSAVKVLAFTP